jgi:hypothetical protein
VVLHESKFQPAADESEVTCCCHGGAMGASKSPSEQQVRGPCDILYTTQAHCEAPHAWTVLGTMSIRFPAIATVTSSTPSIPHKVKVPFVFPIKLRSRLIF